MTRTSWWSLAQSIPAYHMQNAPLGVRSFLCRRALILWRSKRDSLMIALAQAPCQERTGFPNRSSRVKEVAFSWRVQLLDRTSVHSFRPQVEGLVLSLMYKRESDGSRVPGMVVSSDKEAGRPIMMSLLNGSMSSRSNAP